MLGRGPGGDHKLSGGVARHPECSRAARCYYCCSPSHSEPSLPPALSECGASCLCLCLGPGLLTDQQPPHNMHTIYSAMCALKSNQYICNRAISQPIGTPWYNYCDRLYYSSSTISILYISCLKTSKYTKYRPIPLAYIDDKVNNRE